MLYKGGNLLFGICMDKVDVAILGLLKNNAKIPNSDIAKELKMVPSAIWERVRKLEERGVIKKYVTVIDPQVVGLGILAFATLLVDTPNWSDECSARLSGISNIEELHEIIGEDSYLVKIRAKNMMDLSDILKNKIGAISEIKSTKTVISVNSIKEGDFYQSN